MEQRSDSLRSLGRASGIFIFIAVSGWIPFWIRYGVFSQWILLLHILAGGLAAIPLTAVLFKHLREADREAPAVRRTLGVWAGLGWLALCLSGLWLTGSGFWSVFVPRRMHLAHLVIAALLGTVGLLHLLLGVVQSRSRESGFAPLVRPLAVWLAVLLAGCAAIGFSRRDPTPPAGEFGPSNARTGDGRVIPAKLLVDSESCGAAGCHRAIYDEWVPSAHHFSGADPFYATVKANYIQAQGLGSGRYCAGCHEPISLVSGETIPPGTSPNSQAGSSCIFCHVLRNPDVRGNANYTVTKPDPYLFELSSRPLLRRFSQALIRLHPEQHRRDYDAKQAQTVEFCGTCHKQYLDKRVNGWGFVQLQNQYDDWKNGPWHTDKSREIPCQGCHMHEEATEDPARNERGVTHEHRILASNTFVPEMLHLEGARQQIDLVEQWLTGRAVFPEIDKVWPRGPIVTVELIPEAPLARGQLATLQALVINTKVGHAFPTGPLDVIQSWLELTVNDALGQPVFSAGTLDSQGLIQGKTIEYRSFLLDRKAQVLYNHALWDAVGARDKRVILPGASDSAEFRFPLPRHLAGPLRCKIRLLYRKFNPQSLAGIFPNSTPPPVPITEISSFTADFPVQESKAGSVSSAVPAARNGPQGSGR